MYRVAHKYTYDMQQNAFVQLKISFCAEFHGESSGKSLSLSDENWPRYQQNAGIDVFYEPFVIFRNPYNVAILY